MRLASLFLGAVALAATASPAFAICCWNPAICIAVCGDKCCGPALKLATPVDPRALNAFVVQDLTRTYSQAEPGSDLQRLLAQAIQARGGTVPAR